MSFTSALSSGQYDLLRGTGSNQPSWSGEQYLTICPCTTIFAARINGAIPNTASYAQVVYDTVTVGAYGDIKVGQTMFISATNDVRAAYLRLRIRAAPTSTVIPINEISAAIADNDYIFVVDHYDATDKLAKPYSATVQYKDFDLGFATLQPVICGVQTAYAGKLNSSNKLRIAFNASSTYAATSGATISSYTWTFAAGSYTVISGSLNSSAVTVDFNAGYQWGRLLVADSNGQEQFRAFAIVADDGTLSTSAFNASVSGTLTEGWTSQITNYSGVSAALDGSFVVLWRDEWYNGTNGVNVGNNIDFVGWWRSENMTGRGDDTYSWLNETSFTVQGVAYQLASQAIAMRDIVSPAAWDEIKNLTNWRAIVHYLQRHTTVLTLCDLRFDSTADTFRFSYLTTQGTNALQVVTDIAAQINGVFGWAMDGRIEVVRDAHYLDSSDRTGLTTVAAFDNRDVLSISWSFDHYHTVGKVDGDGAGYDGTNTTAYRSRAPGQAQGRGDGSESLSNQVLAYGTATQQAELNQRVGNAYSAANNKETLVVDFPDGYNFICPTLGQVYTFDLDNTYNNRGRALTTSQKWLATNVNFAHDNERGTRTVQVTFDYLTPIGDPGITIPQIIPNSIPNPVIPPISLPPTLPPESGWLPSNIPPIESNPPAGQTLPLDGNIVATWANLGLGARDLWVTRNFIKFRYPIWLHVLSTAGGAIVSVAWGRPITAHAAPCWVLVGTAVYYTPNAFAIPVVWTFNATPLSQNYQVVKAMSTPGVAAAYSYGGGFVKTAYTTDYGVTWTETTDATAATPQHGYDVTRLSDTQVVAAADKVYIATALGGAFSLDHTSATSVDIEQIVVPFNTFGNSGAANNIDTTTPRYVYIKTSDDSDNVYKVTAGTATDISLTNDFSSNFTAPLDPKVKMVSSAYKFCVNEYNVPYASKVVTVAGHVVTTGGNPGACVQGQTNNASIGGFTFAEATAVIDLYADDFIPPDIIANGGFITGLNYSLDYKIDTAGKTFAYTVACYDANKAFLSFAVNQFGLTSADTNWHSITDGPGGLTTTVRYVTFSITCISGDAVPYLDNVTVHVEAENASQSPIQLMTWKGTKAYIIMNSGYRVMYMPNMGATNPQWYFRSGVLPRALTEIHGRPASKTGLEIYLRDDQGHLYYSGSGAKYIYPRGVPTNAGSPVATVGLAVAI